MTSLRHDEAVARAELLRVDAYRIDLDLTAARGSGQFGSTTTVRFSCTRPGAETFVELVPASIVELTLNGKPLDPTTVRDNRLPLTDLRVDNALVVRASMVYSNNGDGLHRFTDPEDGEVYLYAMSGLDHAPRVFACFDQPDLKAPITLTVTAPPDWTVWANGAETRVAPGRWEFAETAPLSTYLFTVVAGPYHTRRAEHDGIPLGLACRRSLAPLLDRDAEEIFALTGVFFDRYHELFDIRYPYGKYDQAFVPEFNAGAVENPGCVTFREEFLFRSAVTEAERQQRAVVIAHEMAHMWFGDLVTMRWWDDIWLSESFAEFMGWRLAAETDRFRDAWTAFSVRRKSWGYVADQRPSTHPVAAAGVVDTAHALLNFDGISYAKGASALRQLVAWLGDEVFLAGLWRYFRAHAHGNATLADLLAALAGASGRDLAGWAEVWLRRPQVNTLRPEVTVGPDGRYQRVTVLQTAPPEYPTLRPHRIRIASYGGAGPVDVRHRVEVDLDPAVDGGRTPVPGLVGTERERLLLLNDGDLTFAKVRFDPASRVELGGVLADLDDPLARALIWAAAADAAREAELSPADFLDLAVTALPTESDVLVFEESLGFAHGSVVQRYLAAEARPAALRALAGVCRAILDAAPPGSDRQLAAARGWVGCAGATDADTLAGWLRGGDGVPDGLAMDAELRWAVLRRLVALGGAGEREIAGEQERDPGAAGAEHAAWCRAAVPGDAAKARAWDTIVGDDASPIRLVAATAAGFWQPEQADLTAGYVSRYFTDLPANAGRTWSMGARQVAAHAYPRYAVEPATLAHAEAMLGRDELDPTLRRVAGDATDELRRALAARALT